MTCSNWYWATVVFWRILIDAVSWFKSMQIFMSIQSKYMELVMVAQQHCLKFALCIINALPHFSYSSTMMAIIVWIGNYISTFLISVTDMAIHPLHIIFLTLGNFCDFQLAQGSGIAFYEVQYSTFNSVHFSVQMNMHFKSAWCWKSVKVTACFNSLGGGRRVCLHHTRRHGHRLHDAYPHCPRLPVSCAIWIR